MSQYYYAVPSGPQYVVDPREVGDQRQSNRIYSNYQAIHPTQHHVVTITYGVASPVQPQIVYMNGPGGHGYVYGSGHPTGQTAAMRADATAGPAQPNRPAEPNRSSEPNRSTESNHSAEWNQPRYVVDARPTQGGGVRRVVASHPHEVNSNSSAPGADITYIIDPRRRASRAAGGSRGGQQEQQNHAVGSSSAGGGRPMGNHLCDYYRALEDLINVPAIDPATGDPAAARPAGASHASGVLPIINPPITTNVSPAVRVYPTAGPSTTAGVSPFASPSTAAVAGPSNAAGPSTAATIAGPSSQQKKRDIKGKGKAKAVSFATGPRAEVLSVEEDSVLFTDDGEALLGEELQVPSEASALAEAGPSVGRVVTRCANCATRTAAAASFRDVEYEDGDVGMSGGLGASD